MISILKRNKIIWVAIALIGAGVLILTIFFYSVGQDFKLRWSGNIMMPETGQVGDFIGGVVGTVFALAGTVLLVITLMIQIKTSEESSFESSYFELIKLHKENVAETRYRKFYEGIEEEFHHRKAFQVMYKEFEDCFSDVLRFLRHLEEQQFLEDTHKSELQEIIDKQGLNFDAYSFAKFNLAYSIFFFGVGEEGQRILKERFKGKFKTRLLNRLIFFLSLKPRRSKFPTKSFRLWEEMRNEPWESLFETINKLYDQKNSVAKLTLNHFTEHFSINQSYVRFYGGHQHRLSHYFRHLFQTYEYLDNVTFLYFPKKYEYGKILRSQLSTYEQLLLFCNSVSELGWKWEYRSDNNRPLITDYKLIKNIPGERIKEIKPADLYPRIEF